RAPPRAAGPSAAIRGAAAEVEGTMFVARAPAAERDPAAVARLAGDADSLVDLAQAARPPELAGSIVRRGAGNHEVLISLPNPSDARNRIQVRVTVETVDASHPALASRAGGEPSPAAYERHPPIVSPADIEVSYVVRVSMDTDPLNVVPALGHEFR